MGDYQDRDGNPITLDRLVRQEPAWAANRIRAERATSATLRQAVRALVAALPRNCWCTHCVRDGEHGELLRDVEKLMEEWE